MPRLIAQHGCSGSELVAAGDVEEQELVGSASAVQILAVGRKVEVRDLRGVLVDGLVLQLHAGELLQVNRVVVRAYCERMAVRGELDD